MKKWEKLKIITDSIKSAFNVNIEKLAVEIGANSNDIISAAYWIAHNKIKSGDERDEFYKILRICRNYYSPGMAEQNAHYFSEEAGELYDYLITRKNPRYLTRDQYCKIYEDQILPRINSDYEIYGPIDVEERRKAWIGGIKQLIERKILPIGASYWELPVEYMFNSRIVNPKKRKKRL